LVAAAARGFAADLVESAAFPAAGFALGFVFAAADAAVVTVVFGAGAEVPRRLPIRSGRVDGSAASTPLSPCFAFAFCFLGLSTLSAMASRVYGSRSGRGARPPSTWHPEHSAAPSYRLWVHFARLRD
jgi:hypothetical protein